MADDVVPVPDLPAIPVPDGVLAYDSLRVGRVTIDALVALLALLTTAGPPGSATANSSFKRTSYITPPTITGNVAWNPTGFENVSVVLAQSDANGRIINTINAAVVGAGDVKTIFNAGSFSFILRHDDGATGTAANRMLLPGGVNLTVNPYEAVELWYDPSVSRWRAQAVAFDIVGRLAGKADASALTSEISRAVAAEATLTTEVGNEVTARTALIETIASDTGMSVDQVAGQFRQGTITIDGRTLGAFGGVRRPTPPLYYEGLTVKDAWFGDDVLPVIIMIGQSHIRGQNTDGTDALLAGTAMFAPAALMPGTGLHANGSRFDTVVPLVESLNVANVRETLASGLVNHLIKLVQDNVGFTPRIGVSISARSGQEWQNLGPGSDIWYNWMVQLQSWVDYAASIRRRVVAIGVYGQGDAEPLVALPARAAQLQQVARYFDACARQITGQSEPALTFMAAPATGQKNNLGSATYDTYGPPMVASLLQGDPLIRFVNSLYGYPVGSDKLHLTNKGYNRSGMGLARAIYQEYAGQGWTAFLPRRYVWRANNILDIEFSIPDGGDLVLGAEAHIAATAQSISGFQWWDRSYGLRGLASTDFALSIPAAVAGGFKARTLRITFQAPVVASGRLAYAHRQDDAAAAGENGPTLGARGRLASSTTYNSLYETAPQWQERNRCLPFEMDVCAP